MSEQPEPRPSARSDASRTPDSPGHQETGVSRRTIVRGAAVGTIAFPLLAACGGGSSGGSNPPSGGSDSTRTGSGAVSTSAVPVGGGVILPDQDAVVTQPTKGQFKAFTATCTHMQCQVGTVSGGEIICPCHGSRFSITDGSPVRGPATQPLAAKKVAVRGGRVTVA